MFGITFRWAFLLHYRYNLCVLHVFPGFIWKRAHYVPLTKITARMIDRGWIPDGSEFWLYAQNFDPQSPLIIRLLIDNESPELKFKVNRSLTASSYSFGIVFSLLFCSRGSVCPNPKIFAAPIFGKSDFQGSLETTIIEMAEMICLRLIMKTHYPWERIR